MADSATGRCRPTGRHHRDQRLETTGQIRKLTTSGWRIFVAFAPKSSPKRSKRDMMRLTIAMVVSAVIAGAAGFIVGREMESHQRIAALTYTVTTSGQEIPNVPLFALAMAERDTEAFVVRRYPGISVDICMALGPYSVMTSGQTDDDFPMVMRPTRPRPPRPTRGNSHVGLRWLRQHSSSSGRIDSGSGT